MITIEEVSSAAGLETLRAAWEDLQARSAPRNVFLTFEWASAWWRHLGAGRRLRVLVVRDSGRACAILPLVEEPVLRPWFPLRRLRILGTGLSDRLDLLLGADPVTGMERALAHLAAAGASWDLLELREIEERSPTLPALEQACADLGLRCERASDSESPYLEIDGDWESFFAARFGRERRQQMRRKARRLEAGARARFATVATASEVGPALERLAAVRQHATYRGEARNSIFASAEKRAFFAEVATRFAERGWLRISVLDLEGTPAAFRFSFEHEGTHYDYYHGFDQRFASLSPGQVLLGHVMQDCFRRGLREVDLLRGAEAWKAVWTERRRRHVRARVFRGGPRSAALRLLLSAYEWSRTAARALARAG